MERFRMSIGFLMLGEFGHPSFLRRVYEYQARWVVDGNIWTTSGVSAGIDGVFAFIEEVYGKEAAENIQNTLEYDRHRDPSWDPWADLHGL